MEGPSGGSLTVDPDLSLLEEKRVRRRAKNKAKKEESKRVREEEIRRKLYEPKNPRIRLVKHEPTVSRSTSTSTPPVLVTSEDFPNLGSGKHRPRLDKKVRSPLPTIENYHPQEERLATGLQGADSGSVGQRGTSYDRDANIKRQTGGEECELPEHTCNHVTSKNVSVKPKRADPITIDLLSVLRKPSVVATEKKVLPPGPKKKNLVQLSGNQLDASKPERKKGKTRETPKPQKPSHLKCVILQDRQARKALQSQLQVQCAVESREEVIPHDTSYEVPLRILTNNQISEKGNVSNGSSEVGTPGALDRVITSGDESVLKLTQDSAIGCKENVGNEVVCPHEITQSVSTMQIDENKVTNFIHSRKFRDYCDHIPSRELDIAVTALITDIVRFQDRSYFSDPVKAHAKRRFVLGFREMKKYLVLKKLKLVVIAPDLETARSKGGIEDTVAELKELSRSQGVSCVFSVARSVLRKLTNKSCAVKGISCIGVLNYEGSQDNYHTILNLLPELRSQYQCLTRENEEGSPSKMPVSATEMSVGGETEKQTEESVDINKQVVATFLVKLTRELETK